MKKVLCMLLAVLMLACCAACNDEPAESSSSSADDSSIESTSSDNSQASDTDDSSDISEAPEYLPEPSINGVKLSEYTLVYQETVDSLKFQAVVYEIVDYVKGKFGIEMNCRSDRVAPKGYEIIVGLPANRKECNDLKKDYGYGGYKLSIKGNAVVMAGSHANGSYFAAEEFIKLITENTEITDIEKEGEKKVYKLACVGDSITQGVNSKDNVNHTYPAFLQKMLGWQYHVLNAGASGYSIIKTDPYAYCKSAQYNSAKRFEPDIIIFSLGTNDVCPSHDYKDFTVEGRKELFMESARELLDSFLEINPDVQLYFCYSSALFKVGDDKWNSAAWNEGIVTYIRPMHEQLAAEYNFLTIDFWEWSKEHSEIFTDGLHPADESYLPYAEYVYESVKDTILQP